MRVYYLLFVVFFCSIYSSFAQPRPSHNQCSAGDQTPYASSSIPTPDALPSGKVSIPVSAPMDPNEIVGTKGYDALGDTMQWVAATESLPYTIYFENDPELATAAAQKVEIRCSLHAKADLSTFAVGAFGFGSHVFSVEGNRSTYQQRLDLVEDMGIFVDVVAGIDVMSNEAFWIFQSIDPATGLPPQGAQEGFLPVNDEQHSGEGYVSFAIKPKANTCVTGDGLTAMASIVFDVNEAIPTNVWHNTVDALPPTTQLTETEGEGNAIILAFSGEDDPGGCGIKQYKLYVSDNYKPYQLYGTFPSGTAATFPTEYDHCYRFFCLGEDNVGNVEAMKDEPDLEYGNYNLTGWAAAYPEEAGTVTGSGTYLYQTLATVTAIANPGYEFSQWTNHGVPVSTEATYSFSIVEPTELVAQFVPSSTLSFTLDFVPGWNWFSMPVECSDGLFAALKDGIAEVNSTALIKNATASSMLQNGNWSTSSLEFINESMYLLNIENASTLTLSAPRASAAAHPIAILPGWNWIGYVSASDMAIEDALSSLEPNENDLIKSANKTASYNSSGWKGSLSVMEPGGGYMYYNGGMETQTLVYPASAKACGKVLPSELHWTTDPHRHATNLVVMATLDADRFVMEEGSYEIGAFVEGECRGSARLQRVGERQVAFLVVNGEPGETVCFQLYDVAADKEEGVAEEQLRYVPNAIGGSVEDPVVLHFRGATGIVEELHPLSIYPNPTTGKLAIEGFAMRSVSVYNVMGQQVLALEGVESDRVELDLGPLGAGLYTVSVRTSNGTTVNRLVVKE